MTDSKKSGMCPFPPHLVDEETQKNDLDIVREVLKVTKEVPIERAYDFSFAKDSELTISGLETLETFTDAKRPANYSSGLIFNLCQWPEK